MAFVQKQSNQNFTGTSVGSLATGNMTGGVVSGNKLIVAVFFYGSTTTTTVTDTLGNTYTQRGTTLQNAGGDNFLRFYDATSSGSGTNSVTVTFGANRAYPAISVSEYSNLGAFDQYAGQAQVAPGTGTDAVTSGNATPTAQPATQFGLSGRFELESNPMAAGTGFNDRGVMWNESRTEDRTLSALSASAVTFTAGVGAGTYLTAQLIYTDGGGGGGSTPPRNLLLLGVG